MANRISTFFAKSISWNHSVYNWLVLPWWLIDVINSFIIRGYSSKFSDFSNWHRFTYGLILPWWLMVVVNGNKMGKTEGRITDHKSESSSSNKNDKLNWKCKNCGLTLRHEVIGGGGGPKCNHPYHGQKCSAIDASNSSHQWVRDYS